MIQEKPSITQPNPPAASDTIKKAVFFIIASLCLFPFISAPLALLLGLIVAWLIGHPYLHLNHKATHILLQVSVVGLGFGMDAGSAFKAGKEGLLFTVISITCVFITGYFTGKLLKIDRKTSHLIAAGTAICGGSAIAALSPVIKAEEKHVSVALGTIFILNAVALLLFPLIGHHLHLSQTQFGLWCAIAIQDTSSVVGAASKYDSTALTIATTVKLARALWIIPLSFLSAFMFKNKGNTIKIPYFIGLFVLAMLLHTYVPFIRTYSPYLTGGAKAGLTLTLFLIGCGLSPRVLRSTGFKPMLQGIILWIFIATAALWAVIAWA